MVGDGHVLLHLVHLLRVEVRRRVLGAVDDARLQRLVHLGERHRLRQRAQRLHLRRQHLRRLDAHLLALDVGRRLHRLVGAHDLEAVVPVREAHDALALELLEQRLAGRTVGDLVQLGVVVEDVRQVEHLELAHAQRPELRERRREHLHRAERQRLHLLAVLVQRRVRVQLDLDLAGQRFSASSLNFSAALPFGVSAATTWLNLMMIGCCASAVPAANDAASGEREPMTCFHELLQWN